MTNQVFSQQAQNFSFTENNGGLNTTASPLNLKDNEASAIQNVDLDLYGAIKKRNGYLNVNASEVNSGAPGTGIFFYETSAGTDYLMAVFGSKLYKMDSFDGTFDDITGGLTITDDKANQVQWKTYRNTAIGTNNVNLPFKWNANGGMVTAVTVNAGGTNYSVGDWIFLTGAGDGTAVVRVATLGASDSVATVTLLGGGSSYSVANGITTDAPESPTLGSGCTINVTTVTTNAVPLAVPYGLTRAKTIDTFFGFTLLGNVTVSGVDYKSRLHWSYPGAIERYNSADWVDIARDDGQELVCVRALGDRFVIFKERSIYIGMYTGDTDIPFTFALTPSNVGCIARDSIQEVNNGLIFLSYDGLYYFDGSNSTKISDKLNYSFRNELSPSRFNYACSSMRRSRNAYMLALSSNGAASNDMVLVWDYYTKAFYKYTGMAPNAMVTLNTSNQEKVYFVDYDGFAYLMDTGVDDYPLGVQTAIDAFYKTKWLHFGDIVTQKGIIQAVLYLEFAQGTLTLGYSYDFETANQYSLQIDQASSSDVFDSATFGDAQFAGSSGFPYRADMTGRGRVIRISFENNSLGETFRINGFGLIAFSDTTV